MKKVLLVIAILASLLLVGYQVTPHNKVERIGTLLSAVASNSAASARTFTIGADGTWDPADKNAKLYDFDKLVLRVFYDYTAAAGTITITCLEGATIATATYSYAVCSTAADGTCTLGLSAGKFVTASLSADTYYRIELGLGSSQELTCTFVHSAPAAGEKLTVTGLLIKDSR